MPAGDLIASFRVHGMPATQGSMRAFLPRGRKVPIVTHDNKPALRGWRDAVASEALRAMRTAKHAGPLTVAVSLALEFYLPIPKSRPQQLRTARQLTDWAWPARKPDIDKLARAALDAITGIVLLDDAQIVELRVSKMYDHAPGLQVRLWKLPLQMAGTQEGSP